MTRLKVFHIVSGKANPDTLNGVNKVVHALATAQKEQGIDVTVIAIADNDVKRHMPSYTYQLYKKSWLPFLPNAEAMNYILENSDNSSIFHFHSVFVPWFLLMMKKLKKHGRNHIVLTPHGGYQPGTMRSLKKNIYFKIFDSKVLKLAEATQIMGYVTERNSYIENNARRIVEIPNGFNDNVPSLKRNATTTIGALCRLDKYHKGLDILLKAFAKYKSEGGKCILKIAGSGPHEQFLKGMASDLKIQDYVTFLGPLFGDAKWEFLNECIAHIAPSRFEGMPTACLESASLGCIQLISLQTNLGKYVEKYDAGIVFLELSEACVYQQLMRFDFIMRDMSLLEKMSEGAKKMVIEELNWGNIARQINKLLYEYKG